MKKSQRQRLYDLLCCREWISLPQILDLRISQYCARIYELRQRGAIIESKTEQRDGGKHSWFRLVSPIPAVSDPAEKNPLVSEPCSSGLLFDPGQPDRSYRE